MHDYYTALAAAFVRGTFGVDTANDDEAIELGRQRGLRLHKFKRTSLPRVVRVLGVLKGLAPSSVLDIGSGRGAFLWPLLDAFPDLDATAIDVLPRRVDDINAAARGCVSRVRAILGSAADLPFPNRSFDIITALEVIEHLESPSVAARELLRVARRFVIASVPSKPDDNPQHIQFFRPDSFQALWTQAGAASVKLDFVANHMLAVVRV